jgi:hypothetical protein
MKKFGFCERVGRENERRKVIFNKQTSDILLFFIFIILWCILYAMYSLLNAYFLSACHEGMCVCMREKEGRGRREKCGP